jgi:predicted ATPase/DNA-binding winged helix-turn-helix (wHTH) protein
LLLNTRDRLSWLTNYVSRARLMSDQVISFGPFRLLPTQKLLFEGDSPVRIGNRARDVLLTLISRPGELVTKEELIARVWPNTSVEESSLRLHIAALRRALGDGQAGRRYVTNIPGRGYSFVAPITNQIAKAATAASHPVPHTPHNLPALATRVVGRSGVVRTLAEQLATRRLVSLVGPGGIGKTTVAIMVANEVANLYPDGVRFVDLTPIGDASLVTSALAFVLDVPIRGDNPITGLIAFLKYRKMLILLDSCEHVVDSVAQLVEEILNQAPDVHFLATSREALRARDERVQRLSPLGIPTVTEGLDAEAALQHSAVELFVERATACLDDFRLDDADAPIVAEVCRKLDGNALAIELAASLVDVLGVRGVADNLHDRFRVLTRGRRTALPRHQTLGAALDWSYELLTEPQRVTLRRLGVFTGWFSSESAVAVAGGGVLAPSDVVDCVADLVAKSLVTADTDGPIVYFRLLDTTRAYAFEKLTESNEIEQVSRSHATHYRALFERAESEWETRPTVDWLADYARQIDNLRAALNWAFSPAGDSAVGVDLTLAAVPLWFQLSLVNECRERVERALAVLDPDVKSGDRRAMKLHAALGWSLMYTTGHDRSVSASWQTTLKLAEDLADIDYQLRAVWGLWASRYNNGEYREALALAERFSAVAVNSADPADSHIGNRMIGVALHFLGAQTGARRHIERMLSHYVTPVHRSHIVRFQFEQRVTARITLARVLWLQGFADQAVREVEGNIKEALAIGHKLSLCNALANAACPVALLAGDLNAAERYIAMLSSQTQWHGLEIWRTYADVFRGELLMRRGQLTDGLALLQTSVGKLRAAKFAQYQTAFLGMLAENLARAGRVDNGRTAIDEALLQSERTEDRWCISELLRIKGEIALLDPTAGAAVAEQKFFESIGWAHRQQAPSWELRSTMSLARLWSNQGRGQAARGFLAPVYGQFTEGFGTTDLRAARSLLDELSAS